MNNVFIEWSVATMVPISPVLSERFAFANSERRFYMGDEPCRCDSGLSGYDFTSDRKLMIVVRLT